MTLLLDLSHTSHTRARTGVQRVVRSVLRELGGACTPVTYDPYEATWRTLEHWEEQNLGATGPAAGRGARWPLVARLRGRTRRFAGRRPSLPQATGLIVPEIFSPGVEGALPGLLGAVRGPRIALFHDALALQYPEFAPRSTASRFPAYLRALLAFDGIAAVSESSRKTLEDYWSWLGVRGGPPVAAIPLGTEPPPAVPLPPAAAGVPTVLCVGSIEGRKNHGALLEACEVLWQQGRAFNLRIVGMANLETGGAALAGIEALRAAGRPLRYDGPATEEELEAYYSDCSFTIYPSVAEGFGMPVAESLSRGRPCLCRMDGALGEIAAAGGCSDIGAGSKAEIAAALSRLLDSPYELAQLAAAARARRFKDWGHYVTDLRGWMASLPKRS